MKKFSWYTTTEKDRHGRYVGAEVFGAGGPFAFCKCYEHYKPNSKGRHTHNHVYNKCHKHVFRSKQARKNVDREDKKEFVRVFYLGLRLNNNFGEFLYKIFHHNKTDL